jgi:hypothetical protein
LLDQSADVGRRDPVERRVSRKLVAKIRKRTGSTARDGRFNKHESMPGRVVTEVTWRQCATLVLKIAELAKPVRSRERRAIVARKAHKADLNARVFATSGEWQETPQTL